MTGTIQRNRLPRAVRDKILPETAERGQWRLLANCDETMELTCWGYQTRKWTVRVILHFIMVATVNIWFERSKESSFFDHALLLADEILAHAKKKRN